MKYHLSKTILLFALGLCCFSAPSQDRKTSNDYFVKGQQKFNSARYMEAIEYYSLAIGADSTNFNAWIRRGFSKGLVKDFDGELSDYTSVIEKDPKHIWAYISRGSAKNRRGEYASAMDDFNKAIAINPKEQEAYNNRGFAKKSLGDKEGACEDWVRSRKLGNEEAKIILKNNLCK